MTMKHFSVLKKRRNSIIYPWKKVKNVLGKRNNYLSRQHESITILLSSALFDRIDKDHNGTITKQELKDWIKSVQTRYITDDVERQWKQMNNDSNNEISWDEYDKTTYYALCKFFFSIGSFSCSYLYRLDDDIPEPKQVTDQYLRLQKKDRRRYAKPSVTHFHLLL